MKLSKTTGTTSADIRSQIDKLLAAAAAADAAIVAADTAYQEGLIGESPAALRKILDAKADAAIEGDQARAQAAVLEREYAAAAEEEAEARRRANYNAAAKMAESARVRLFAEYDPAAALICGLIAKVVEADTAVGWANADLPIGAEPIATVESARGMPGLPGEIVSQKIVDHWCLTNGSEPILNAPDKPAGIYRDGLVFLRDEDTIPAQKRKFVCTERLPPIPAVTPASLTASISLPGLRAEPAEVAPRRPIVTYEPVRAPAA